MGVGVSIYYNWRVEMMKQLEPMNGGSMGEKAQVAAL